MFSAWFEKRGVVRPAPVWEELLVADLLPDAEDADDRDPAPDPPLDFPPELTGAWDVPEPPVDAPPEPVVPPPEPPPPEPVVPPPEPVVPPPEPVDPPPEPVDPPPEPLVFVGDGLGDGDVFVGAGVVFVGAGVQVGVAVGAGVGLFVGAGVQVGVLAADAGPLALIMVTAVSASTTAARISALAIESPIGRRFRITGTALLPGPGGWLVTRFRHII